jgi:hypothetical protein
MSKNTLVFSLLFGLTAAVSQAGIAIAVPAGSGSWYQGSSVTLNNNNSDAFWDNTSIDGTNCNVGYWLNAATWPLNSCSAQSPGATGGGPGLNNLNFFASSGGANNAVGFGLQATNTNTAIGLRVEVAGQRNINRMGWFKYTIGGNGAVNVISSAVLFGGPANPGATNMFTIGIGETFGFWTCANSPTCAPNVNGGAGVVYSTNGSLGRFALFSELPPSAAQLNGGTPGHDFWLGLEDGTDRDFNDAIFKFSVVPEPGFYGGISLSLSVIYLLKQRRRKTS